MTGMVLTVMPSGFPKAAAGYPNLLRKNVNLALKTLARDVVSYARQNHIYTTRTGAADRSIDFHAQPEQLAALVGFDVGVATHGLMLNDGTKPHTIIPKRKKALRWVGAGGRFAFAKKVRHPGTKAMQFIEGAARAIEPQMEPRLMAAVAKTSNELAGATGGTK